MADEVLLPMSEGSKKNDDEDVSENVQNCEKDDLISSAIGDYGKWQFFLTFALSLVNIPCTWHIFVPTFHSASRLTWCSRTKTYDNVAPELWINCTGQSSDFCSMLSTNFSGSDTCEYSNDSRRMKCTDWEYGGIGSTIISEFNLVCDRENLNSFAEMVFLAGVAIGGLICGIISDKCGRKRTLMTSITIQTILGTIISFSPWFILYAILRAILGFMSVSVVFSGFVLAIELVGGHWRTVAGLSYLFPVSVSYMSIAGIAWSLRNWRHLQIAISLPGFIFFSYWWLLPESPRWLLAVGRTKEVHAVLEQAARFNNKKLPKNFDKLLQQEIVDDECKENVNVWHLFKTPQMRKKTLCLFLIWFSIYLGYYGLVLNLANIGGNLYINTVIQGAVEIPAVAISIFILLKGGRRWPLTLTMVISGVACLLIVPLYFIGAQIQWLITALTMLSKFAISSSNAIIPVYTAELYPTTIRNIGVGASNVPAGVALMLVPYLWHLSTIHSGVPMSMLATFGIVGGLSVLLLPETGGSRLVDTLREEEHVAKKNENEINESKRMNNNCCT